MAVALCATVLAVARGHVPAAAAASAPTATGAGSPGATGAIGAIGAGGATSPPVPPVRHVFVVNLENTGYRQTWGSRSPAPYLSRTLRSQGVLLTRYFAVAHHSLPNYIAQISGQGPSHDTQSDCTRYTDFRATGTGAHDQVLGNGCVYPASVRTIADQLTERGFTWKAYQEDIGNGGGATSCRHPLLGADDDTVHARRGDQYATRHDPFVYFHAIVDDPACAAEVVGLDALAHDLASEATTPNLSYIAPNLCNDGHDDPCVDGRRGGLPAADAWVQRSVSAILASPAFRHDGMLVITFDEAEGGDARGCCGTPAAPNVARAGITGPGGGRVGALVLSPFVRAGTTSAVPYNHYSLLCSLEDVFGLDHLGYAGTPGLACFGADVWSASASDPAAGGAASARPAA